MLSQVHEVHLSDSQGTKYLLQYVLTALGLPDYVLVNFIIEVGD